MRIPKEDGQPIYSRALARRQWRKLSCRKRNSIKWACDQQDKDNLHAGFIVYKQMM